MTSRRRSTRSRGTRRRTGRNVWVNHDVNTTPAVNSLGLLNIMQNAPDFMTFDTTVVSIVVVSLQYSYVSIAPAGIRRISVAFQAMHEGIDAADITPTLTDGVGPPYMGVLHASHSISGLTVQNLDLTPQGPVVFKSKRRFRENETTLFMINQSVHVATDTTPALTGFIRTLLHIP